MRTKLNILMCALFVLGLAVSQVHAQYAYRVGATHMEAAQYGHNQMVGTVFLLNVTAEANAQDSDVARPDSDKIDISIGGLVVTNTGTDNITVNCGSGTDLTAFTQACETGTTLTASDDKKTLTLTVISGDSTDNIAIRGLRVDVSGLDVDTAVVARVSSAGAGGIDFGTGAGLSANRHVATVKAGLTVDVSHASQLYCSDSGAGMPSLKVGEGFASAWEAASDDNSIGATQVKLKILRVPSGITFIWPGQKHDDAMPTPIVKKDLKGDAATDDEGKDDSVVAMLNFVAAGLSSDTTEAIYEFQPIDFTEDAGPRW